MSTVKIVLRKKENKDGSYPLALRITKDRKSSFIHLGYHLLEDDWDDLKQRVKKSHPNAKQLNNFLLRKLVEASDKTIEVETHKSEVSSKTLKQTLKPNSGSTFFTQADMYLKTLKEAGKYSRHTPDKSHLNGFKQFLKGSDIIFPDVTETLLNQFKHHLLTDRKVSERTAVNHLVVIRSVFSQAIKEGATDKRYYPFGQGKIAIRFPDSNKIGLSIEEVQRLESVNLANPNHNHARNLWLVSFYFGGMRISDVLRLKWSDFKNDRLYYTMGKNLKPLSLKVHDKVLHILDQYKEGKTHKDDLVFAELKSLNDLNDKFAVQHRIADCTSRIDKFLRKHVAPAAGITHRITMHIARHTFGHIAGDTIPVTTLQAIFRHSDLKTTIGYMANFMHKNADDALDSVISF